MTNREKLNRASDDKLAAFIIRYTNCAVCVAKDICRQYRRAPPSETAHSRDPTCKEFIMQWLQMEEPKKDAWRPNYNGGKQNETIQHRAGQ